MQKSGREGAGVGAGRAGVGAEASQCPTLDGAKLANGFLLAGVFRLAWIVADGGVARVNWRDMGAEELGSVYESLLELVPRVDLEARRFTFATGDEAKGNARKTTGSYYTPDSLVQVLLDSALEPVVKDALAAHPADPVAALLELSVVDPACGSGHFLLAAARRLAGHVARLSANGTPSAAEYRHALRLVVGRCIYGVDLNPMAIELCRVGLWMEAVEPGLALSFLDSHIQCGNALLGATPELLAKGVPDAAWEPIEGDDKRVTSALKRRNKTEASGRQMVLDTLWAKSAANDAAAVVEAVDALERCPDAQLSEVQQKALQWDEIRASAAYRHQRFVADLWCSAFVWPKLPGELANDAPTHAQWQQVQERRGAVTALVEKTARDLAEEYQFFHWHLAFPKVHGKPSGKYVIAVGRGRSHLRERAGLTRRRCCSPRRPSQRPPAGPASRPTPTA
ncbi:MAG: N-6 DNA methylase [Polyangiales bacterium]